MPVETDNPRCAIGRNGDVASCLVVDWLPARTGIDLAVNGTALLHDPGKAIGIDGDTRGIANVVILLPAETSYGGTPAEVATLAR